MTAFLFSLDVEDVRDGLRDGDRLPVRLPALVEPYLDFLRRHRATGTFFIVGEVARRHPEVIRRIMAEGHEIGCHSDRHIPLERLNPETFRSDTERNLDALHAAGAKTVVGYRAPGFSLTADTCWAHEILAQLDFRYSSSVLPAPNPINGWPGFGRRPKLMNGAIWEIPITLLPLPLPPVPAGGGVYFRALPRWVVRHGLRSIGKSGQPLAGYFHPYDVDQEQLRLPHPGFSGWSPFNWLMYRNRHVVFDRLELAAGMGFKFTSFERYAMTLQQQCDASR